MTRGSAAKIQNEYVMKTNYKFINLIQNHELGIAKNGSKLYITININDKVLCLNWHDSLLVQSFRAVDQDKIILRMEQPTPEGEYELVMEVIFTRK